MSALARNMRDALGKADNDLADITSAIRGGTYTLDDAHDAISMIRSELFMASCRGILDAALPGKCPRRRWNPFVRDHKWTYGVDVCGTRPYRKCVGCDLQQAWMSATGKWMNVDVTES
jgi:hypothetical protein